MAKEKKKKLSAAQKKALNKVKHCAICGYATKSIALMGKHYRNKHPKHKKKKK